MSDYTVRRASPRLVLAPVFTVAAVAVWKAILDPPWAMVVLAGVGAIVAGTLRARALATQLRVDSRGITLGAGTRQASVRVPWASVREIVIVTDIDGRPRVGVRLRPGAPLPDGVRGMVQDPAHPDRVAPSLVRAVPGLDRVAFEAALRENDIHVVSATEM